MTAAPEHELPGWSSSRARALHARRWAEVEGSDILPLTTAEFDVPTDPDIIAAVQRRLEDPLAYEPHYTSGAVGATLARFHREEHGIPVSSECFWLVAGVIAASRAVLVQVISPGDEVLFLRPSYRPIVDAIVGAGGVPVAADISSPRGIVASLREALSPRTRAVYLCHPHNPTGHSLSADDLGGIAELARESDLVILCNELHARLTFQGRHVPAAASAPERVITFGGATKSHNLAGLGGGFVYTQDADWAAALRQAAGSSVPAARGLQQLGLQVAYSSEPSGWLGRIRSSIVANRRRLSTALVGWDPTLDVYPSSATGFIWARSGRHADLARELERDTGIRTAPGRSFGVGDAHVRIAVPLPVTTLEETIRRLSGGEAAAGGRG
ncbi:pyridoxal phosphate-dependent aminotransferase [Clavibacter capsici]|uniref:cysteine-S-conjugate beta-lyase n=1 Tax=Clavibacter capsici TaxID=1874630 RepID=A0A0M4HQW1_9MICO|nr:pyridoxal phosphate-dependent aminotransferase [Clavibacter capsici]ALD12091.1 hypothetical protein AES38_03305 [Clavibacter capsici]QIS38445.1 pyridoxal phosphate-dependent aminotransferase [Clavibacter capsici]QIS41243.1 pyridoxal phosphate-dependent aminotransferase [Clavibacter capsici]QIS44189.1 pyridoxal phosphate-dependent aminotransferase [Clavibacter capsici]